VRLVSSLRQARSTLRSIGHDEQLSVVGHLDELRTRLFVSLAVVAVAFGFCFWQNHALLHLINSPLAHQTQQQVRDGHGPLGATYEVQRSARDVAVQLHTVVVMLRAPAQHQSAVAQAALARASAHLERDVAALSAPPRGDVPVTLGIGEPFTTTVTVSAIFALILSLPVLLLEAYGFLMPAFDPRRQREMRPLILAIPAQFNVLVQASQYYKFAAMTILAMGLLFQVPVGVMAITRAGVITPRQLRHNRRYAIAACALIAAVLPGDAITMLLETVPLYVLFEGSVLLATIVERRGRARERREAALAQPGLGESA
jgi:sec-independent protein translocase protein TatC